MKKALIQYTFGAGLGDIVSGLYECLDLALLLRNNGYSYIKLRIFFVKPCQYIYPNDFFKIFNLFTFASRFDEVRLDDDYIYDLNHDNLTYVYSKDNPGKPSKNVWDLFLEKPSDFIHLDIPRLIHYFYGLPVPSWIDILSNDVMGKYESVKKEKPYVSMMFRFIDGDDGENLWDRYIEEQKNIIEKNDLIFISSNSYKIKKMFKEKNLQNIFLYDSIHEEKMGNHLSDLVHIVAPEDKIKKTEHALIEMLTHSDATEINLFSCFNGISSFLFFSNVKKVKKNLYYLLDEKFKKII